jgi:hypothetical protein
MPRNPNFLNVAMDRDTLLEFTMYFMYEKDYKHTKFEARTRMTVGQLVKLGGMNRLQLMMDDILYDVCGIQTDEFDKTTMGFRSVEGQPSQYGTYKINDVFGGYVYPKGDKWGSMEYVWR